MAISILILAAGAGRRFRSAHESQSSSHELHSSSHEPQINSPELQTNGIKQLARVDGKSLLVNAIELAHSVAPGKIFLVLGYEHLVLLEHLRQATLLNSIDHSIQCCVNQEWQQGLGSSISVGVNQLSKESEAVLVLLADQVALQKEDLVRLLDVYQQAKQTEVNPLVCAGYGGSIGVPAIFPRRYFNELKNLSGDQGAKQILVRYPHIAVPMPQAMVDIDTAQDLENYLSKKTDFICEE